MMNNMQEDQLIPNIPIVPAKVDSAIAIRLTMGSKMIYERSLMARTDIWHKITIVRGAHYNKEVALKAILQAIEPNDMMPVQYQISGEDSFFITRNCATALERLCRTSLIIKNIDGDPLILIITLGYATIRDLKINVRPLLLSALTKRYDANKRTLNLENFHKDPDIAEIYCPLSQLRIAIHVLELAKNSLLQFEHLDLRHNELSTILAIEVSKLKFVKYLDLRHNNLLNMQVLVPLKQLKITKLWLDGNPVCENYPTAAQYVKSAKKYCPNLQELDGVGVVSNLPFTYRDYFVNEKSKDLVYKFVSHFFNLFDQADRTILRGLYHKNACYSMSFAISIPIAQKIGLGHYVSRNLWNRSSRKKPLNLMLHFYHGEENILIALNKLPRSYHDKSSFIYDVMYDDDRYLVICVSGLFKKLSHGSNVLSFSRTFILSATLDNEYHILNDQYHIWAAPAGMNFDKIDVKACDDFVPICFSANEKSVLIKRFGQIAKVNSQWAEHYLLKAQWDMRKAISTFMKEYKDSEVPEIAFYM